MPFQRKVSGAQIVQSIIEEESNDGTHETKSAQLRCRRMGPERAGPLPGKRATGLPRVAVKPDRPFGGFGERRKTAPARVLAQPHPPPAVLQRLLPVSASVTSGYGPSHTSEPLA